MEWKIDKKKVLFWTIFIVGWPVWGALALILAFSFGVCSLADYLFNKYMEKYGL